MKYLVRFDENIQREDPKVVIDEILDKLLKKGKLSKSEKEFMDAAATNKITSVSVPKPSGSFWSDISNPHNLGTMYQLDGSWKVLKDLEQEEDEELEGKESSEETWSRRNSNSIIKYSNDNPGLKDALNDYLDVKIKQESELEPFIKRIKSFSNYNKNHNLSQKIEYALGSMNSLFNQFGPILNKKIDPDTGEYIENKES